jgi:hypothetical protein
VLTRSFVETDPEPTSTGHAARYPSHRIHMLLMQGIEESEILAVPSS